MLPEPIKEQLCRELLEEFGAVSIRHRPVQQELTHGCLINPDQHTDQVRNPTASLNYGKLTYKCLGCNAQGGLLWLITRVRGCTHEEARAWLSKETGTGETVMPLQQLLDYYDALYSQAARQPAPSRRTPRPCWSPGWSRWGSTGCTPGSPPAFPSWTSRAGASLSRPPSR